MPNTPLGPGVEFDRIRDIARALGAHAHMLGNDTAPMPDGAGTLVSSIDVAVEGVHFRTAWLDWREIGWRAAAAALSDLAAAAAAPSAVLVALCVPAGAEVDAAPQIMAGVGDAAAACGAAVIGGDLSNGPVWSIAVSVHGHITKAIARSGARVGDGVWVTGALGGARAALEAWQSGVAPDAVARTRFAHPVPRIAEGQWLVLHGATAMIDLSDGLGGDAQHLAAASNVRIDLRLDALPVHASVIPIAMPLHQDAATFAASGGEDYELLLTMPAGWDESAAFAEQFAMPLTRVGSVAEGAGVHATLRGSTVQIHGYGHAV